MPWGVHPRRPHPRRQLCPHGRSPLLAEVAHVDTAPAGLQHRCFRARKTASGWTCNGLAESSAPRRRRMEAWARAATTASGAPVGVMGTARRQAKGSGDTKP